MSNEEITAREARTSRTEDWYRERRKKRIANGKTCGHVAMYVGSALMVTNFIQPVREKHNTLTNVCLVGTGAMLSIALGNAASRILDKTIDKGVEFFDDINPRKIVENKEESENG